MPSDLNDFHLLRPELLLLFIPAILAFVGFRQMSKKQSSWKNVISPHLLKFLMVSGEKKRSYFGFWLTAIMSCLIILAVSGPTFRQKSVPVFQTETARVILLDLSLSMGATDIKPNRISRAKNKIMDLLERSQEGTIGLVVYAGDAFIISPLTSDANTIASMIPTLSTGIMPVLGSRPDIGITKAIELLDNAKRTSGQIIWITDGVDKNYIDVVSNSISATKHLLSILAIGTSQGAPIPLPDNNGFLQDASKNIVVPKLESKNLKQIVQSVNGQYMNLTADSGDIDFIFDALNNNEQQDAEKSDERISRWIDDGYWLSWILLILMLVKLFARNSGQVTSITGFTGTLILFSLVSLTATPTAQADIWDDLWKTRDQQANEAFKKNDFKKASELFENKAWRGSANYKQDDFTAAVQQFSHPETADAIYNYANSLAKSQQLEKSIEQYNKVLEQSPEHEDALFNKKIVEDVLKEQQEQEKKDQQDKEKQENKDQDESDSDSKQDSEQDSEEQEKENSEKQDSEQESDEKSEQEKQQEQKEAELSEDQRDKNEKDKALEHWLEKIPDDPGGLLRRKMYREYQRRGRQQKEKKVW